MNLLCEICVLEGIVVDTNTLDMVVSTGARVVDVSCSAVRGRAVVSGGTVVSDGNVVTVEDSAPILHIYGQF